MEGPNLEILDTYQIFHINTFRSNDGMVEVILQAYYLVGAKKSEAQEQAGLKSEFDKSLEGLYL